LNAYVLKTFGCKANISDSLLLEAELQQRGWVSAKPSSEGLQVKLCIINSCTVTDEADRQSRKMAARLSRDYPNALIVVTGCAAEIDPERLLQSQGIRYVIGNRDKGMLVERVLKQLEGRSTDTPPTEESGVWPQLPGVLPWTQGLTETGGKTRAFIKIQEGCNSFCTYCIIPYARGPSRSLRQEEVLAQIRQFRALGIQEVVLTGTNIGDFGSDWQGTPAIEELVRRILGETDIPRLRLSSLDPTEITPELIALMEGDSRFCPHFHVSLQSPSDPVLRKMKRRYSFTDILTCLERLAGAHIPRPLEAPGGVYVGMDVIVGFPGETPALFGQTLKALEALPWTRLHIFPYSERQGTPATRLPGVIPQEERIHRAKELAQLSRLRLRGWHEGALASIRREGGKIHGILLEQPHLKAGNRTIQGYTPNFIRVAIEGETRAECTRNAIVSAEPKQWVEDAASGEGHFLAL